MYPVKIIPLLYIVALLFTSVVWGAVTDIVIGQRAGANQRFVQRVVTGSANPLKPLGFSSDGVLSAVSQLRGISLRTPDGGSNIDLTTNGTIKITVGGNDSIDASQRKLYGNQGDEVLDWQNRILLFGWSVEGSLKVGSEIVTVNPLSENNINTQVALNTVTVSSNTSLTFSTTPPIGQVFGLEVRNSSASAVTISFPTSKDSNNGATVTSFIVPASPGLKVVSWRYTGSEYIIYQGGSGGSGDITSSTVAAPDRLASFSDTTGKVIKDSGETVTSLKSRANHTGQQAWNTINGLPTTLAGYGITDGQPLNNNLSNISLLADPNVDRLLFWDDSNGSWRHLTLGTNLSITDTTLNSTATSTPAWSSITGIPTTLAGYGITNAVLTGLTTNQGTLANTANPMAALAIDVSKELNTKTISANTTFTFNGIPAENQWFGLYVKNTGAAEVTVTFPVSKDSVTGSTITTATVASTTGRQHLYWRYDGTDYILYRGSAGGSGGTGDAKLVGGNSWTGDQIVSGSVSANSFTGEGSGLTLLSANQLTGTIPDITTAILTTSKPRIVISTPAVGDVINTDNGETTFILNSTAKTLTYSAVPTTGTRFEYSLIGHTSDCVVTIPATYSFNTGGLRTTFTVPANKLATIWVKREADRYVMAGDPTFLADLPNAATPSINSLLEIDQGTSEGSQKATLANIKKTLRVGTKRTGTIASGAIGNVTLNFESTDSYIYYVGDTATHTLPDAAANENCAIVYSFNGSYVITLTPDSNDFIRYNAITLADATAITITGTIGQTAIIISDGTNWTTAGGNVAYATAP